MALSKRSWSAWSTPRCWISGNCECWQTKWPRRREERSDVSASGRIRAALPAARRRCVDRLEGATRQKSARAHDVVDPGAAGLLVHATADALGYNDHSGEPVASAEPGKGAHVPEPVAGTQP